MELRINRFRISRVRPVTPLLSQIPLTEIWTVLQRECSIWHLSSCVLHVLTAIGMFQRKANIQAKLVFTHFSTLWKSSHKILTSLFLSIIFKTINVWFLLFLCILDVCDRCRLSHTIFFPICPENLCANKNRKCRKE